MVTAETPLNNTDKVLLEPYNYLRQHPGKEVRSKLILAFESWLPLDLQKRDTIIQIIEMLHTASLMVDDVEDGSNLRRSVPGIVSFVLCQVRFTSCIT